MSLQGTGTGRSLGHQFMTYATLPGVNTVVHFPKSGGGGWVG